MLNGLALWDEHIITNVSKRRPKGGIWIRSIRNMYQKTWWIREFTASDLVNVWRWQVGRSLNGGIKNSYLDRESSWKLILFKENGRTTMEWRFDKCLVYDCALWKEFAVNLLAPEFIFNFSTPVYKMWIIQEPNILELWNKLHFEEEKAESIYHV